jgi:ketosteroid isomerase-like protein
VTEVPKQHELKRCYAGRDKVLQGWQMIFRGKRGMQIRISNVRVSTAGNMGFVTCEEHVGTDDRKGNVIATNVFEKQGDTWKIVHHHGSIMSPAVSTGLRQ